MYKLVYNSGYAQPISFTTNIRYVNIWSKYLNTAGRLIFYGEIPDYVTDVYISQGGNAEIDLSITMFPHIKREEMETWVKENYAKLESLILEAAKTRPDQSVFTVDFRHRVPLLVNRDHFTYAPPTKINGKIGNVLFSYEDCLDDERNLPALFFMEALTGNSYGYEDVFENLVRISRVAAPTIEKPTYEGIRFSYMLLNSFGKGDFRPDVPNLNGVSFPTRPDMSTPYNIDLSSLYDWLENAKTDSLVVTEKDGIVDTSAGALKELKESIIRQITDKKSISLTDAVLYGVEDALTLVPTSLVSTPIPFIMDIPDIAQRMCILKDSIFAVPFQATEDSIEDSLGLNSEYIVRCDPESYPGK